MEPLRPPLPALDGGWGWMVVAGCGLMYFLQGVYERSFGVVYVSVLDKFDCSAAMASTAGGLFSAFRLGCGTYPYSICRLFYTLHTEFHTFHTFHMKCMQLVMKVSTALQKQSGIPTQITD